MALILLSVAIVVLSFVAWRYGRKYMAYRELFHSLAGEPSYSYLHGNLHKLPGPNEERNAYAFEISRKFKYMISFWFGPLVPVIVVYHPDSIRPVLKSSALKPRDKLLSSPYDMMVVCLGEGLLTAVGPRWARNRRLLAPAFRFDILKSYIDIYNQCSQVLVKRIRDLCSSGQSFYIFEPVDHCTLDVILRCAFSYHSDCQTGKENEYITAISEIIALGKERIYRPLHFVEWIYGLSRAGRRFYHLCDVVHAVSEAIIENRRKELESEDEKIRIGSRKTRDFLETLLTAVDENGCGLSNLEIRNEVDTLLVAGHDTTASAITWTLYRLAQHSEYQERVYGEIAEVLGDRESAIWEDLPRLEFTTMCIKEAMRLDTIVPFIWRELEEDTEVVGSVVPAGTYIVLGLAMLHQNPHIWDRPLEYLPERFHPDKRALMDPFQYIPFYAGSRNCIGQNFAMDQIKITIANVIRNFRMSRDASKPARRTMTPKMKPEAGAIIFAQPRDKSDA